MFVDGDGDSDSDNDAVMMMMTFYWQVVACYVIGMLYVQVFKAPVQCFTVQQWWPVQCGEKSFHILTFYIFAYMEPSDISRFHLQDHTVTCELVFGPINI